MCLSMVRAGSPPGGPGAGRGRRSRSERTAARRRAEASAEAAVHNLKEQLALGAERINELEEQLVVLRGALGDDPELAARLALVASVLAAKLSGKECGVVETARRNTASHCFTVPAATLADAPLPLLNRIERSARRRARRQRGRAQGVPADSSLRSGAPCFEPSADTPLRSL